MKPINFDGSIFILNKASINSEAINFDQTPAYGKGQIGTGTPLAQNASGDIFTVATSVENLVNEVERLGVWTKNALYLSKDLL